MRLMASAAAVLIAGASSAGCAGGHRSSPAVVDISGTKIARAEVDHWAHVITLGNPRLSLGQLRGSPREKALQFLIAASWLIGAAGVSGHEVSAHAVDQALEERIASTPNGRGEFRDRLSAKGQTIADVRLELEATLAAAAVRESLMKRFPPLTHEAVARYYNAHPGSFDAPDERVVDLIENLPSAGAARALGRTLGAGRRFAERAQRESVPQQTAYEAAHRSNGKLVHAIFAATPDKLAGPVPFKERWVLLVVRRIVPGTRKPIDQVAEAIATRLLAQRRNTIEPGFLGAYRSRWRKRTKCRPGFVVQQCAEYRGRLLPEADPLRTSERGS